MEKKSFAGILAPALSVAAPWLMGAATSGARNLLGRYAARQAALSPLKSRMASATKAALKPVDVVMNNPYAQGAALVGGAASSIANHRGRSFAMSNRVQPSQNAYTQSGLSQPSLR